MKFKLPSHKNVLRSTICLRVQKVDLRAPVWTNVNKQALAAGFGDLPGGRNEMAKTQHELKLVGE